MYEKTIAGEHRYYDITINSTPSTLYDLLSPADKLDYDSILKNGVDVQSLNYPSYNTERRYRTPLDGYVVSTVGAFYARTSADGTEEQIVPGVQYLCPVYFWPHKTWFRATNPTPSLVRIFFS